MRAACAHLTAQMSDPAVWTKGYPEMNVLLVAAATPDTFWSFKHALRFVSKRAALPPLGLLTIAGMLPRDLAKNTTEKVP